MRPGVAQTSGNGTLWPGRELVGGGEGYTVVLDLKSGCPLRDNEGTGDRGFHDVDDG